MRLASVILKILAILLATIPFFLIGLFFLCGGPDPGVGFMNLLGVPFLLFATFWALPNRILLNWRVGIGTSILCYALPISFGWAFFAYIASTGNKSTSPFDLTGLHVIVVGIGSAALSYLLARKVSRRASEKKKRDEQSDSLLSPDRS